MIISEGVAQSVWAYEERDIIIALTSIILVRILIAKVNKWKCLEAILRTFSIRTDH